MNVDEIDPCFGFGGSLLDLSHFQLYNGLAATKIAVKSDTKIIITLLLSRFLLNFSYTLYKFEQKNSIFDRFY